MAWWKRGPGEACSAPAMALAGGRCSAGGCGEKTEGGPSAPDQLTLALDFYVNADHAGIYEAQDQGYFRDAGLDVTSQVPSEPVRADQGGRRRTQPTWRSPTSRR